MKKKIIKALLRVFMGWIFLWAFLDKLYGLGFATEADKSWLAGGSPTTGFLKFATHGPFASIFQNMAGSVFVDWLFMIGLLLIGLALILGIGMKIATATGSLLMLLMWLAAFPPEHNPFVDDHLVYILVLGILKTHHAGDDLGLGRWWSRTSLVKKYSWLR